MRVVFLGTPHDAVAALRALHDAGHDIALVVTQPDRRRGRGGEPLPTAVKEAATELDLPVVTPDRASEVVEDLRRSGAELGVVVAFGQLLKPDVLQALPLGYVNIHYSLLPRWRGAAPVERAILAGDRETGVCLMQLAEGLDTGPVFARETLAIDPLETAGELRARLSVVGAEMLVRELDRIPSATPEPQEGQETYAAKLTAEEFEIDWSRPAEEIARWVRAGNPAPGAWTTAHGRRLKILRAVAAASAPGSPPGSVADGPSVSTGDGLLELVQVQSEGKRPVGGDDWYRGTRGIERLGT